MRQPPTNICPMFAIAGTSGPAECITDSCAWWDCAASECAIVSLAAELELSRILQGYGYPVEVGRAQSYGEVPDLSGLPGVHIECKRAETLRLSAWMQQAERDAERFGDGAPAVFFRRSRSPWCVMMKLEDWMAIYKNRHELPDTAVKGGGDNA